MVKKECIYINRASSHARVLGREAVEGRVTAQ